MTWRVRWRRRTSTVPGLTWTGRSGCGRRPALRRGRWWPASRRPARGALTATSGSTCPMIRATRSALTGTPTRRRWPTRRHISPAPPRPPCGRPAITCSSRPVGRGFATWAALRELGRSGVAELVDRCCTLARRFATQLGAVDGISVVNDVVLNQVLLRFGDDGAGHRGCAALGPVPDGLDDLAWPAANAHLGVELAYHRGGCRPVGTRDRCRGAPLIHARAAETGPALPGTPSDRYRAGKARGGDPAGHRDKEVALA